MDRGACRQGRVRSKASSAIPPKVGADPQALRNPRPESGLEEQRNIQYGFRPVGFNGDESLTPNRLKSTGEVGEVTVVTS